MSVIDIISVCRIRDYKRCKDCIYYGSKCNELKHKYNVTRPKYINKKEIFDNGN